MTLWVPLACGLGVGLATWMLVAAFAPARPELRSALDALDQPRSLRAATSLDPSPPRGSTEGLAPRLVRVSAAAGYAPNARLVSDLEVVGRSYERHVLDKTLAAAWGFVVPLALWIVLTFAGMQLPAVVVVVSAVGLCVGGFVLADVLVQAQATERRAEFAHAFSLYLGLVSLQVAGGAGIETSLAEAADAGEGWPFAQLRAGLTSARVQGTTPWEAFAELGDRLRLPPLSEFAASVSLAGEHGAKVRASLAAKAESLRDHEVRDAESEAEAASERMTVPVIVLVLGFVVFIGYPALGRLLTL